ncbi:MAG: cytochrome d ubiquinol oxidase subunit II, partial [Xanthomonadales bacterium]|nr:cytochrome d ubiquinol oxidase subunit II [Xanthomonadales bacterium]MDX2448782.1 cytochrome d ubiquinol oxidase subunit II [Desulfobacterales bacterium]
MEPTTLQITWFILFGILIGGYAILDGFDLGVGFLSMFTKKSNDRRLMINAVGPVWDGNEVWLVTGGGALFAAFPPIYATSFSSFYLAIMLLLLALIARAVSMEFRGKVNSPSWRRIWDWAFGLGSTIAAVLFGVAVGNIMTGIPLDENHMFTGNFLSLLHVHPIAMGLLSLAMFATHGALYMAIKSEGPLASSMVANAKKSWIGWMVTFVGASATA